MILMSYTAKKTAIIKQTLRIRHDGESDALLELLLSNSGLAG